MNLNQASKEAENLRKKITQHNHKYYVLDDQIFQMLNTIDYLKN